MDDQERKKEILRNFEEHIEPYSTPIINSRTPSIASLEICASHNPKSLTDDEFRKYIGENNPTLSCMICDGYNINCPDYTN